MMSAFESRPANFLFQTVRKIRHRRDRVAVQLNAAIPECLHEALACRAREMRPADNAGAQWDAERFSNELVGSLESAVDITFASLGIGHNEQVDVAPCPLPRNDAAVKNYRDDAGAKFLGVIPHVLYKMLAEILLGPKQIEHAVPNQRTLAVKLVSGGSTYIGTIQDTEPYQTLESLAHRRLIDSRAPGNLVAAESAFYEGKEAKRCNVQLIAQNVLQRGSTL